MCADSAAKKIDLNKKVGLYPCHNQVVVIVIVILNHNCYNYQGGNQYWMLSKEGEIRRDEACFDYSGKEVEYLLELH